MHRYAIQGNEGHPIEPWMILIGVVSIAIAWLGAKGIEWAFGSSHLPFLQAPSAFAIFGGTYVLFEKYLWRWKIFRVFSNIPNLNGEWKAYIQPLPAASANKIEATLCIHQSFRRISITLDTSISSSYSITASIEPINPGRIMLRNQYKVLPKASGLLEAHEGANNIIINLPPAGASPLGGTYYTEAKRHTHGEIAF